MGFFQSSQCSGGGAVCVFQLKGHITPVRTLAFSPDGMALASGGVGGLMNIWSLRVSRGKKAAHVGRTASAPQSRKERLIHHPVCVCVCLSGWLRAPESGRRFRCHPEHCLDPRCGRGRLFQQVKGQAPQHCFFWGGLCRCVLCLTVLRSSPVLCRTCWW